MWRTRNVGEAGSPAIAAAPRGHRMRAASREILLQLLIIVGTLAAVELLLRVADLRELRDGYGRGYAVVHRYDPMLGWLPIPNSAGTFGGTRTISIQHNSLGLRDVEHQRSGRPTVLFVGRLEKRKGLKFLLRAWPMVLERQPDARLVVVGRGRPLEGYRRFAARQGWGSNDVVFAGYVSSDDLPRYYQSCDVFCAPNTGQESFGIVLLEAMAAGAPIVASDIPGYRDVLSNGLQGLLVEPRNPGAIADAVCRLLGNPELRASMRRSGQVKAQAYDWPQVAAQVLDYYYEVLERREIGPRPQRVRFARVKRMAGMLMRV